MPAGGLARGFRTPKAGQAVSGVEDDRPRNDGPSQGAASRLIDPGDTPKPARPRLAFKDVVGFQRHAPPLASDTGLHGLRLSSDGRSLRLGLALRQVLPFCYPSRLALLRAEAIQLGPPDTPLSH